MTRLLTVLMLTFIISCNTTQIEPDYCDTHTFIKYVDYAGEGYALFSDDLRIEMSRKSSNKYAEGASYEVCFEDDDVISIKFHQ